MADITRVCGACGRDLTVSEFADVASLRCPSCGEAMQESAAPRSSSRVHVKDRKPGADEANEPDEAEDMLSAARPDRVELWLGPERWRALRPLAHWVVFVVALILLGFVIRLRFDALVRWALYGG